MKLPIYLALVLVCFLETAGYATSRKPNIILFLIDDQDKSSITAYGGKTYTRNLDQMAAKGMKFNHAQSNTLSKIWKTDDVAEPSIIPATQCHWFAFPFLSHGVRRDRQRD